MTPSFQIRSLRRDPRDIHDAVTLILRSEPAARQSLAENNLVSLFRNDSPREIIAKGVYSDTRLLGVCVAKLIGGRAGLIVGSAVEPNLHPDLTGALWQHVETSLRQHQVAFMQGMCEPGFTPPLLKSWGFTELATLDYYSVTVQQLRDAQTHEARVDPAVKLPSQSVASIRFRFAPAAPQLRQPFIDLVAATYVNSLDCPEFSSYRRVDEVIDSYLAAPNCRTDLWRIAQDERGTAQGCLILTLHSEGTIVEVTYMGVVSTARGRGIGRAILQEAARLTNSVGASQLVLAVDRSNSPAVRLYQAQGFECFYSEAVWVRRVTSSS